MSWDPALLRKYSSTNHYKLLNQVRSDLKEQPIQRSSAGGTRRGGSAAASGGGGSRRRSAPAPVPQAAPVSSTPANSFDPIVTVPVLITAFE
ncbi:MAG: hypothetical protein FJ049_00430 [Cyanobacteria bacterium M_surface_7_m2_037]|nr:hypothetical protein [Cyanobacteria bacterium M_surface_7_m2_037]